MSVEQFTKLAPFARRAAVVVAGRERLFRMGKALEFVLITTDISAGSRREVLAAVRCPVVCCLTSAEVEMHLGLRGTKVVGFKRSSLARGLLAACRSLEGSEE
ncbi:MAG: hypothetical protein JXR77_15770 [Lentisphaeria bacterium]|nr:hypothetical protein [Lentisphaeria bacterium]